MKKASALPLFGDAYMADTMHLTLEEHGAYLRLLMLAWRAPDCCLPDDDRRLARMLGISSQRWTKIKPAVMDFWTLENGRWSQKRLKKERIYVEEKSQKNAENARAGWSQRTEKKQDAPSERICETPCENDAPPPPPHSIERERRVRATLIDPNFTPILTKEAQRKVDAWPNGMLDDELYAFINHAQANARTQMDWQAAFRTWIGKADQKRESACRPNPAPSPTR
jgi:Uncharacterized protein conserved in bacteria